ncbi:unnamed protein product, partial [Bubo scandiacus]
MSTPACTTQILAVPLGTDAPLPKRQSGRWGKAEKCHSAQKTCKDRDLGKQKNLGSQEE